MAVEVRIVLGEVLGSMGIPEPSGSWTCFYFDPSRCVRIKMPLKEVCDLVPEPVKMPPAQHRGL